MISVLIAAALLAAVTGGALLAGWLIDRPEPGPRVVAGPPVPEWAPRPVVPEIAHERRGPGHPGKNASEPAVGGWAGPVDGVAVPGTRVPAPEVILLAHVATPRSSPDGTRPGTTPAPGAAHLPGPAAPALAVLNALTAPIRAAHAQAQQARADALRAEALSVFQPWEPWPGDDTLIGMTAVQ